MAKTEKKEMSRLSRVCKSLADFVTDALRKRSEELKILRSKPEPPALEHFNVNQDHVTVIDHKRRMFADVYFREGLVYCELYEEENCEHVKYALSLSQVNCLRTQLFSQNRNKQTG